MSGERRKDPDIHQLRQALEALHDMAEAYRVRLEAELAEARAEPDPYEHLLRALERQVGSLLRLEQLLEEQVWPALIGIANGSAYVHHTRTRDHF